MVLALPKLSWANNNEMAERLQLISDFIKLWISMKRRKEGNRNPSNFLQNRVKVGKRKERFYENALRDHRDAHKNLAFMK